MFYVPLKLRDWKERVIAKGPNFNRARKVRFRVGGSEISLRLPRSRARSFEKIVKPKSRYDLDDRYMRLLTEVKVGSGWRHMMILRSVWDFYGPWFLGRLATISMNIGVIQQYDKEKAGTSYFHPRVFEHAMADLMVCLHDELDQVDDGQIEKHIWFAPSEWQPLERFPMPAARFVAKANKKQRPYLDDRYYVAFPIHDHYIVWVGFVLSRRPMYLDNEPQDNTEDWLPIAPMRELIDNIIDSLSATLSPEAETQMCKAQEGLDNPSLVREFAPVNVPEYQRRAQQAQNADAGHDDPQASRLER